MSNYKKAHKMDEFYLELIKFVERNPVLYNQTLENFKNKDYRNKIWKSFADEHNKTVEECKSSWNTVRTGYRNARKRAICGSEIEWKFNKDLAFLGAYNDQNSSAMPSLEIENDSICVDAYELKSDDEPEKDKESTSNSRSSNNNLKANKNLMISNNTKNSSNLKEKFLTIYNLKPINNTSAKRPSTLETSPNIKKVKDIFNPKDDIDHLNPLDKLSQFANFNEVNNLNQISSLKGPFFK